MRMFEVYNKGTVSLLTRADGVATANGSWEFQVTVRGTESGAEHSLTWRCGSRVTFATDEELRCSVMESVALDMELATEGFSVEANMRDLVARAVDELGYSGGEAYDVAKALVEECCWFAQLTRGEREALERLAREELAG